MTNNTNVLGIGNDILEIKRIKESIQEHKSHFLDRIFTEKEQAYCHQHQDSTPHFAGRFAAKEAVSKALGVGIGEKLSWHDIEILNNSEGQPQALLSPAAHKQFGKITLLVTISHCREYVIATAVALKG